jgi:hypothetical protein
MVSTLLARRERYRISLFVTIIALIIAMLPSSTYADTFGVWPSLPTHATSATPQAIAVLPSQSIQAAIDSAVPGDIILLEDGVYYEAIRVTKALTIQARNPGMATLSGASQNKPAFSLRPGTSDVYQAPVGWKVAWVMQGNRNLLNYKSLQNLQNFMYPVSRRLSEPYPGPREGFAYENGVLYVRLLGSVDPGTVPLEVSGSNAGIGITVAADNVVIEGLRIHIWHDKGVLLKPGVKNSTVRHCFFDGTRTGIYGVPRWPENGAPLEPAPYGLTANNNEFSGIPLNALRWRDPSTKNWLGLYDSNLAFIFLRTNMHAVIARNNYLYDTHDAFVVKGSGTPAPVQSVISYNFIQQAIDNPLELDTDDWYMRARVHHNFVIDSFTYLSTAPFFSGGQGALLVDHNIFYNSPERGSRNAIWLKTCWFDEEDAGKTENGLTIVHNTVVLGDSPERDSKLYTNCNASEVPYANSILQNNIIWVRNSQSWNLVGFTFANENLVYGSRFASEHVPNAIHANPGFVSVSPVIDFRLRNDSPAVNLGAIGSIDYYHQTTDGIPDLGAIEYGTTWTFPRPGPRWATPALMPQRPPLPTSLKASWVGLNASTP